MSLWKRLFGGKEAKPAAPTANSTTAAATPPAKAEAGTVPTPEPEPYLPPQAVRLARVVLYQSDEEIQERLGSPLPALQQYLTQVVEQADRAFGQLAPEAGRLVTLFVALKPPTQRRFWIASEPPGLDATNCHPLLTALEQLPGPLIQHGPICLAVQVHLWDADGPEENWPTMPRQWIEASVGRSVSIPEGLLEIVWPEES
jgi:hypothetical protein